MTDKIDGSGDNKQIVNMNEAGGTTLLPNVKSTCIDGSWNATIQDYKCIGKSFSENRIIVHENFNIIILLSL